MAKLWPFRSLSYCRHDSVRMIKSSMYCTYCKNLFVQYNREIQSAALRTSIDSQSSGHSGQIQSFLTYDTVLWPGGMIGEYHCISFTRVMSLQKFTAFSDNKK